MHSWVVVIQSDGRRMHVSVHILYKMRHTSSAELCSRDLLFELVCLVVCTGYKDKTFFY